MANSEALSAKNIMSSIVVFLVALPLCLGIALASGVPPEKGLITGIIGGLVVGFLAGSPLQVSGPAAGLVVIVWQIVEQVGLEGLGAAIFIAGLLQIGAGYVGMGQWFRAVSPTVIYGMLSGIGALIFASQFHVMLDEAPRSSGLENFLAIPQSFLNSIMVSEMNVHFIAGSIGTITVLSIILWEKYRPSKLKVIPGALVGIGFATFLTAVLSLDIRFIKLPDSIFSAFSPISFMSFEPILSGTGALMVVTLFLVASAETLLCAVAVDKLHDGERTNFNRELMAQGVGNALCGIFAALPMTGVIVRSSANVAAGATHRSSAIMHGAWLLICVALIPNVLNLIPTASLAALLVYIGWKLMNFKIIPQLLNQGEGREELYIFVLTVFSIVSFDLLTGIGIGVAATIFQLFYRLTHLEVDLHKCPDTGDYLMEMSGAATFLSIPQISLALERLPDNAHLHVHFSHLTYIDHACLELLTNWGDQHKRSGGVVYLEWDQLHHYQEYAGRKPRSSEQRSRFEGGVPVSGSFSDTSSFSEGLAQKSSDEPMNDVQADQSDGGVARKSAASVNA